MIESVATRRRVTGFALAGLLLALWLASRPYSGIFHDARLYLAQALFSVDHKAFASDLFFRFGSQGDFTVFTALYAPLVARLGASTAVLVTTLAGEGLWLVSLAMFVRAVFGRGPAALVGTITAILIVPTYGGLRVFNYGEPFATPRVFAEAFVLGSLALWMRGRPALAVVAIIAASALHPLIAVAGVVVLALLAAQADRRAWIVIALAVAVIADLAILGVGPFGRLLMTFDRNWWAVVQSRFPFCLLTEWRLADWVSIVGTASVLFAGAIANPGPVRRVIVAAAAAAACGLAFSFVGGDLGHDVLIVNLQPWRALWLATLVANVLVGVLIVTTPRTYVSRDLLVIAALSGAVSQFFAFPRWIFALVVVGAVAALAFEKRRGRPLPGLAQAVLRAAVVLPMVLVTAAIASLAVAGRVDRPLELSLIRFGLAACAVALMFGVVRTKRSAAAALAVVVLGAVMVANDAREPWERYLETSAGDRSLERFLSGTTNVYWANGVELLWFKTYRESYYSCLQGSDAIFFRGAANEYEQRGRVLSPFGDRYFPGDDFCSSPGGTRWPSTTIGAACRELPDLGAIVLPGPADVLPTKQWRAPVAMEATDRRGRPVRYRDFYLYSCPGFRAADGVGAKR